MTDDGRILDIKTGQQLKTKQRTGQDAKRWRRLVELMRGGIVNIITVSGVPLEKERIDEFISSLDDIIKDAEMEGKRLKNRKLRKKTI